MPPVLKILRYLGHSGCLQYFAKKLKKILHLWKIPVISQLRTNFAEMPGNRSDPGNRENIKGDAVVRVSRLRRKT